MDDDHPADIGRPRRRGSRITPLFVAAAYDRLWHKADVRRRLLFVRFRGDCVAKLLAALRTRNYRIQMNGVFESTLRACARP
jgi:hypothetical protein